MFFKTAHEVISKLKEVETSLGDQKNKPTGKLTNHNCKKFWNSLVNSKNSGIYDFKS